MIYFYKMDNHSITLTQVRALVSELFFIRENNIKVSDTDSLKNNGIIDSVGMLDLINGLQEQFGISIEDRDVLPQNLDTLEAIAAYIERKRGTAD